MKNNMPHIWETNSNHSINFPMCFQSPFCTATAPPCLKGGQEVRHPFSTGNSHPPKEVSFL